MAFSLLSEFYDLNSTYKTLFRVFLGRMNLHIFLFYDEYSSPILTDLPFTYKVHYFPLVLENLPQFRGSQYAYLLENLFIKMVVRTVILA